jgi:uncharacterized caspase-like protein
MKLYGVFIGIDNYADPHIPTLSYAKSDAEHFFRLVEESMRLSSSAYQLKLLTDTQATKQSVLKVIGEDLSRVVEEDDLLLLFFSGHGSPETAASIDKTSRYIILYDTEYESIFATGLDMERNLHAMCFDRIRARHIVLFVDTCFSGRSGGRTFEGPHLLRWRSKQGLRGPIRLDAMQLGEGRIIVTACDDNELAREYAELGHGVFTHFLLETLAPRTSEEQSISIPKLYDVVSEKVIAYTHGRQHPVLNGRTKLGRLPLLVGPHQH